MPTGGARSTCEGCDVVQVADGLVVGNEAYVDGMTIARQLGALPPRDSGAERGLTALTNLRTRLARRFAAGDPEPIADGVWVVRGGFPQTRDERLLRARRGRRADVRRRRRRR